MADARKRLLLTRIKEVALAIHSLRHACNANIVTTIGVPWVQPREGVRTEHEVGRMSSKWCTAINWMRSLELSRDSVNTMVVVQHRLCC